jgi:hemerythrin superfamily protein
MPPYPKRNRKSQSGLRKIRRAGGIEKPQSAIALLKADHREVESYFKAFQRSKSALKKQSLAIRIWNALKLHTRIEEEVFYPAFLQATGQKDIHNEALVEHDGAKKLIAEIEQGGSTDSLFEAKVTVLSEMIKHHVKEEERFGGMFSKARRSKMDLYAVAASLEARKKHLAGEPTPKRKQTPSGAPAAAVGAAAARSRVPPSARKLP